jgi:hypothetical protein
LLEEMWGIEVWFDRVFRFFFLLVGDRTNGALGRVLVSRKRWVGRMAASLSNMQAAMTRTTVSAAQTAAGVTSSPSKVRLTAFVPATSNSRLHTSLLPNFVALRTNVRTVSRRGAKESRNAGKVFASVNGTGSNPGLPIDLRGVLFEAHFHCTRCVAFGKNK